MHPIHGETKRRTSCFFSSTLSEAASLAAERRVVALASVWPFATSKVGGGVVLVFEVRRGGREEEGRERDTFVAFFRSTRQCALGALGDLVDGVPVERLFSKTAMEGQAGYGGAGNSPDCLHCGCLVLRNRWVGV